MDKNQLYQQYLTNTGDDMSLEEFESITSILAPEDVDDFVGLKKKDQTNLTSETTSTDLLPQNPPIPISQDLQGSPEYQTSLESAGTPLQPSMDLPSQETELPSGNSTLTGTGNDVIPQGVALPSNPQGFNFVNYQPIAKNGKVGNFSFEETDPVSKLGGAGDIIQQRENTVPALNYISGDIDSTGNPISKEQQRTMYQEWEAKDYGKLYERDGELIFSTNEKGRTELAPLYKNANIPIAEIKTEATPLSEYFDELADYKALPTEEERLQMINEDFREKYMLSTKAAYWAKQNGTTFQEEYDKLTEDFDADDNTKASIATSLVDTLLEGTETDVRFGGTDEQDVNLEKQYYQLLKQDPTALTDLGDFLIKKGYDNPTFIKERSYGTQRKRAALLNEYMNDRYAKKQATMEFAKEALDNSKVKLEKHQKENNLTAYNVELQKYNGYQETYNRTAQTLNEYQEMATKVQPLFAKVNREAKAKEDFDFRVENNDAGANFQNFAGQIPLVIADRATKLIGGAGRLANTLINSDNLRDALDIMATEEIKIGNVTAGRIANRVEYFKSEDGKTYKDINGTLYAYQNGKISRLKENVDKNDLTSTKKETEYNAVGIANLTTGFIVDALFTKGTGTLMSNGARYSAMLATSKRVNNTFGIGSQMAKGAAGLANAMKNPTAANLAYWFTQFTPDSYIAAKEGGIEGEAGRNMYAVSMAMGLATISLINPDTNILKSLSSSNRALVSALLKNDLSAAQKIYNGTIDYVKKAVANTSKELPEEFLQQGLQDFGATIVNELANKNLQVSELQDYKELAVGTIGATVLAAAVGGKANIEIGGRPVEMGNLTQEEKLTLLAREKGGLTQLKEAREELTLESQRKLTDALIEDVATRQKYIDKIPNKERYTLPQLTEVVPVLQAIEKKKTEIENTDDTFKGRLQSELTALQEKANQILDNDQTTPTASTSETAQGNTETDTETATTEAQPVPDAPNPIRPDGSGGTAAESFVENNNSSQKNNTFAEDDNETSTNQQGETRLDNRPRMGNDAQRELVERRSGEEGIYRTAEASNSAGSNSTALSPEDREELESRGLNPDWDVLQFRKTLEEEAKKNNVWLDESFLSDKTLIHDQKKTGTKENDLYMDSDGTTVTKINNLSFVRGADRTQNLSAAIDRVDAHNALFPDVPIKILGYTRNKDGRISMALEQPYIDSERNATKKEISDYLQNEGFKLSGTRDWSDGKEVWAKEDFELYDARPANVLMGKDGNLYFIDTIPHTVSYLNGKNTNNETQQEQQQQGVTETVEQPTDKADEVVSPTLQRDDDTAETEEEIALEALRFLDETIQGDDTRNDGNAESGVEVVQQSEQGGQEDSEGVRQSTDRRGSEEDAEVSVQPTTPFSDNEQPQVLNTNQYERNGKVYTQQEDGSFTVENKNGVQQKVTTEKTVKELNALAKARREESVVQTKEKDGYTYKRYEDGTEVIISPKGKEMQSHTTRTVTSKGKRSTKRVANGTFNNVKAKIFGEKTQNQINQEDSARVKEALRNFVPRNETEVAMLYFASGGKVSSESVRKELSGSKKKITEYTWAWLGDSKQSFENISESLTSDTESERFDQPTLRSELIDVVRGYGSATEIQEEIVALYNAEVDPYYGFTDAELAEMTIMEMQKAERDFMDSVGDVYDIEGEALLEYYEEQYSNTLNALTDEQQNAIYQASEPDQRAGSRQPENKNSGNENRGNESQSEEVKSSPEYQQLLKDRTTQEARVKNAKDKLDRVSKTTNKDFQADQEDLFGERPTGDGMFDERASGDAGRNIIAQAQAEYDTERAELARINKAIRDFENGKQGGTGAIDFQTTQTDFTPIPQSTYDKLVKRLLGVFKRFGGRVITSEPEFKNKLKESSNIDLSIYGEKANLSDEERNDLMLAIRDIKDGYEPRFVAFLRGWYKGKDKKWKRVTKTDLILKQGADFSEGETTLGALINSDELFNLYPDFKNLKVIIEHDENKEYDALYSKEDRTITISINNDTNGKDVLGRLRHEIQHHIQNVEGFTGGTNPYREKVRLLRTASKIHAGDKLDSEEEALAKEAREKEGALWYLDVLDDSTLDRLSRHIYFLNSGEVEATVAQDLDFSDDFGARTMYAFEYGNELSDLSLMRTPNGEIYGAKFPDGTIYLNPEKVNANTPIHEFSHLWQQLMPSRFKKGVELLKNTPIGKRTFAELKANEGYANKSDEELWNEALVTVMGNEGERIFNQSKMSKFKEWFVDFFKKLGEVFGIKEMSPTDKLSTFVKGALSEVMGVKEIVPESRVEQKEVPIYIRKMSNTDIKTMLSDLGLIMDAVCPN